jgi:hydroxymethylbilane synthase
MWQASHIKSLLLELYPQLEVSILGITTQGDRTLGTSLAKIGGKGLFVKELEDALAEARADIAVHSVKDVPMNLPSGFALAAITERADPRDAFVSNRYKNLGDLPASGRVGTSSLRRESLLRAHYPQLAVEPLRGNVQTRLRKLDEGQYDAIILAAAGLKRLGLESRISCLLTPEESMPAVGQGALGIEYRLERTELLQLLTPLNHAATALCISAERALSRALAGSCNVPLGGFAEISGERMRLRGFVGSPDGKRQASAELEGPAAAAESLGLALADKLKAQGAAAILAQLQS